MPPQSRRKFFQIEILKIVLALVRKFENSHPARSRSIGLGDNRVIFDLGGNKYILRSGFAKDTPERSSVNWSRFRGGLWAATGVTQFKA